MKARMIPTLKIFHNHKPEEPWSGNKIEMFPLLWGRLPLELKREILLILAKSSIGKARQLRLVSSDVNILVLPILFRDIAMQRVDEVIRITNLLLPRKKSFVPALKSKLHITPRLLSSYKVDSWVLVVPCKRPSVETALESIAPVFTDVQKLVITGQNIASNAFWLRQHPVHPKLMFLVHFGSPYLVNFYDPIFKSVTHLYTSTTNGHRNSHISDLPDLTHLALSTRATLPADRALHVVSTINSILKSCQKLVQLVLLMNFSPPQDNQIRNWQGWLEPVSRDSRFVVLPDYRVPRHEWSAIIDGKETLWDRAREWKKTELAEKSIGSRLRLRMMETWKEERATFPMLFRRRGDEWEIDLVQRDDYLPQTEDPDLRGPNIVVFG